MEYNGYHAVVTFDEEVGLLHGEVIDTRDVITFQGKSVDELEQAFRGSVEEYLKICEERGRVPDKPFSGPGRTTHGTRDASCRCWSRQDQQEES